MTTDPRPAVVTECGDCPFEYDGRCQHPDMPRASRLCPASGLPLACPLRVRPTLVMLAPSDERKGQP